MADQGKIRQSRVCLHLSQRYGAGNWANGGHIHHHEFAALIARIRIGRADDFYHADNLFAFIAVVEESAVAHLHRAEIGRGLMVAPLGAGKARDLYEIREILDRLACMKAAERGSARARAAIRACSRSGRGGAARSPRGWRERMYQVALRIGPQALEIAAEWLYREMLQAGFTQVCEFHYLHRAPDGSEYPDGDLLSLVLARAAARAGIGLTLLPTLYLHRGFGQPGLSEAQRRFAHTAEGLLRTQARLQALAQSEGRAHLLNAGLALHSLRAVDAQSLRAVAQGLGEAPLHIHVAEQTREVEDCLQHLGQRPVQWLLDQIGLDARWNLVHATHTLPHELAGMAQSGAAAVLCPSTEANLGDGLLDLPSALAHGLNWSIGTDSHVKIGRAHV